jgi:hypothetical protein
MNTSQKMVWWFIGVPIASVGHYFIARMLFGVMWGWGDSVEPPPSWITTPVGILFAILTPLIYVVGFINHIIQVPDFFFDPVSFALSAVLWWCGIAWFFTSERARRSRHNQPTTKGLKQDASPNGGPATPSSNSGPAEGSHR